MSPLDRRRRRRRRRLSSVTKAGVVAGVVVAVLALLLVGGLAKVGSASTAYWRAVDRSFALEVRALDLQGVVVERQVRQLVPAMPGMTRPALQTSLDAAVRQGEALAQAASLAGSPPPYGTAGADVTAAFADRSEALAALRAAVDGLLHMAPLAVPGVQPTGAPAPPATLSAAAASTALTRAGALLGRADRLYGAARRALAGAPGHARLPQSVWVGPAALTWNPTAASEVMGAVAAAPRLAAVSQVVLVNRALSLTPAPVPPGGTPSAAGTSVVPPTRTLTLTAVVANEGTVDAARVVVAASARPTSGPGTGTRRARTVAVPAGGSVAVALPPLAVTPGRTYSVTVTVSAPRGGPSGDSQDTFVVQVAPATPPTTLAH